MNETTDTMYPRLLFALRTRLLMGYRWRYRRKTLEAANLYAEYEQALADKDAEATAILIPLLVRARLEANIARREGMIVAKLLGKGY